MRTLLELTNELDSGLDVFVNSDELHKLAAYWGNLVTHKVFCTGTFLVSWTK